MWNSFHFLKTQNTKSSFGPCSEASQIGIAQTRNLSTTATMLMTWHKCERALAIHNGFSVSFSLESHTNAYELLLWWSALMVWWCVCVRWLARTHSHTTTTTNQFHSLYDNLHSVMKTFNYITSNVIAWNWSESVPYHPRRRHVEREKLPRKSYTHLAMERLTCHSHYARRRWCCWVAWCGNRADVCHCERSSA